MLKGDFEAWGSVVQDIEKAVEIIDLTADLALKAGHLSHGTGMHGFDSLILASLLEAGCTDIYTLDKAFASYQKRGVMVHLLARS